MENGHYERRGVDLALHTAGKRLGRIALGLATDAHADKPREILLSRANIEKRAHAIGHQLRRDYAGGELTLLSVQTGANVWFQMVSDALQQANGHLVSRTPQVTLLFDDVKIKAQDDGAGRHFVHAPNPKLIRDRQVLVVEDIVDSGVTVDFLRRELSETYGAADVKLCTMLDRPSGRENANLPKVDYSGFTIGPGFVVGMGMDFAEYGRDLREIRTVIDKT
jgi:hypoxanthine phosphoribosyltransferase